MQLFPEIIALVCDFTCILQISASRAGVLLRGGLLATRGLRIDDHRTLLVMPKNITVNHFLGYLAVWNVRYSSVGRNAAFFLK